MKRYTLNIARKNNHYPRGKHWALVELGTNEFEARNKAQEIVEALGNDGMVYTFIETPEPTSIHYPMGTTPDERP